MINTLHKINAKTIIKRHSVDVGLLSKFTSKRELTNLTYARLLIPQIIKSGHVIYVDSDFICTKSLYDVINLIPENKTISGVIDLDGKLINDCPWGEGLDLSKYNYINCGFIVINTTRWNENNYTEKIFNFLEEQSHNCTYGDQSAINWILRGDIAVIPNEWNIFSNYFDFYNGSFQPGSINIHYASGIKPWKRPVLTISHIVWFYYAHVFFPGEFSVLSAIKMTNILRLAKSINLLKNIKERKNIILWIDYIKSIVANKLNII